MLALDSILEYLGDTLKSWGILPSSFLAPRTHFLSTMVTFFSRDIPPHHLLHGKDAGETPFIPAPQLHSGRAGLEYFLNDHCTAQPLVESIPRLISRGGEDSAPAGMERPWVRVKSARPMASKRRVKARITDSPRRYLDISNQSPRIIAEQQDITVAVDEVIPGPSAGPVVYLSKPGALYSNINNDCLDFLTPVTEEDEIRLGLPVISRGTSLGHNDSEDFLFVGVVDYRAMVT